MLRLWSRTGDFESEQGVAGTGATGLERGTPALFRVYRG